METSKLRRLTRKFKKYFKSTKKRKRLKIALIGLVALGIGVGVHCHLPSRHMAYMLYSKCRKFFTSSNENINSQTELEGLNKLKYNKEKWIFLLLITIVGVAKLLNNETVEIEILPESNIFKDIILFVKKYRQPIGTLITYLSLPFGAAGWIPTKSIPFFFIGGWQLATHP